MHYDVIIVGGSFAGLAAAELTIWPALQPATVNTSSVPAIAFADTLPLRNSA